LAVKAAQPGLPDVAVIKLSAEQQHVLDLVRSGQNVFFTGPAGTGKSVLLREIIKLLRDNLSDRVSITASTGIAGLNIGGSTVHSFAGIGLGKESAQVLAKRIFKSKFPRLRWRSTSTLIIDEISMLDGTLFDKLEYIARYVRERNEPFGGIQLVLSGDFFQLPPVPDQNNGVPMPATYAFDAECWQRCVGRPVVLSRVFRQKDNEFVDMLSSMRIGQLTPQLITRFKQLSRPLVYDDGIEASVLFPLRAEVEGHNKSRLNELTGNTHIYCSMDSRGYNAKGEQLEKEMAQRLLERLVAPRSISLKIGAQVMLIKNIVQGHLVNGVVGKVVEFLTNSEALKRNIAIATMDQKGSRVDADAEGQLPHRPADLVPLTGDMFRKDQFWPLVRFTNGMELLCAPVDFSVEGLVGNVEALRLQVPLILAWALSIHKSQGQTLSRVKVDLGRIFEKGQAYVALSRATTMETLEVINFEPSKVLAHPRVIAWQETWMTRNSPPSANSIYISDDEMDCEEAVDRSRSLWDLSRCAEALPS
jgi:ATP-dependent DNA helicase PIF1